MSEYIDKYFPLVVVGVFVGLILHLILYTIKNFNKKKVTIKLEQIENWSISSFSIINSKALQLKVTPISIIRVIGLFYLLSTSVFCLLGAIVILISKIGEGLILQASLGFMFLTLLSIYFGFLCHHLRYKTSPTKYTFLISLTSLVYGVATIICK